MFEYVLSHFRQLEEVIKPEDAQFKRLLAFLLKSKMLYGDYYFEIFLNFLLRSFGR